jgi:hypothetical protein
MRSCNSAIEALQTSEVVELNEIYAPERRKAFLRGIMLTYDMADEVMAATQLEGITNRAAQVALATPLVTQMRYLAMMLSSFYCAVCFDNLPVAAELNDTYDTLFQNFNLAMENFLDGAEATLVKPLQIDEEVNPVSLAVVEVLPLVLPSKEEIIVY